MVENVFFHLLTSACIFDLQVFEESKQRNAPGVFDGIMIARRENSMLSFFQMGEQIQAFRQLLIPDQTHVSSQ